MKRALKVTLVEEQPGENPPEVTMSYAEAKEIALLRLELRACWDRHDRQGARVALERMAHVARASASDDRELTAEVRRWTARFAA